jgi:hypothetical protein
MDLAMGFRRHAMPNVSTNVVRDLLVDLNKVWQAHMERSINKLREAHAKELGELRRRVNQSLPYRDVVMRTKISHTQRSVTRHEHARSADEATAEAEALAVDEHLAFGSSASTHRDPRGLAGLSSHLHLREERKSDEGEEPRLRGAHHLRMLEQSSQLSLATCLAELEEVSLKLRLSREDNAELRGDMERAVDERSELKVQCLAAYVSQVLERARLRIKDCQERVTNLAAQGAPDRVLEQHRAYQAMMDDLTAQLLAVEKRLNGQLPATPSQQTLQQRVGARGAASSVARSPGSRPGSPGSQGRSHDRPSQWIRTTSLNGSPRHLHMRDLSY